VSRELGFAGEEAVKVATAKVYLIEGDLDDAAMMQIATNLLADPVTETFRFGTEAAKDGARIIEVHPLPGVMDPVAQSVRDAIRVLLVKSASGKEITGKEADVEVLTGTRYDIAGIKGLISDQDARQLVARTVANPVVHEIHVGTHTPTTLPKGSAYVLKKRSIVIRGLNSDQLAALSRSAHLFLSLDEMRAVQTHYDGVGRDPTDIELETIAQTWSEHCVHKTLKATVKYRETPKKSADGGMRADGGTGAGASAANPAAVPVKKRPWMETSFAFTPKGKQVPLNDEAEEEMSQAAARQLANDNVGDDAGTIDFSNRPGHVVHADGSVTITNLLKSTIAAATFELIEDGCDWALSVFKDNSGVVAFDDAIGICIKVETHNRPSAIEPYGGAATGVGGCIRDIIGTGLGARPFASTNVFCVADPTAWKEAGQASHASHAISATGVTSTANGAKNLPPGVLHARRILTDVVAGVRDYGNRMGIPTVNGAVFFDDRYVGNPLVYCGCVGIISRDKINATPKAGDRIICLGGRTGRDGIHGATFSSAELESSASTEFAHAVQIGNAIEEKRVLEAIVRARDAAGGTLYTAMTDCGAGGFSSAVGEMGKDLGAVVDLERAPVKYAGLSYTEIWISEAQERMVLSVPEGNVAALRAICDEEGVELADLGTFGSAGKELVLRYQGEEVGRIAMDLLHEGIPNPTREATWDGSLNATGISSDDSMASRSPALLASLNKAPGVTGSLRALLSHGNIASKHWIIRQYDHEVRGATVTKPLVGPGGRGPGDATVIEPMPKEGLPLNQRPAIAIGCGLTPWTGEVSLGGDPYQMALCAIDECVRNLVCVGANPRRIAILDNFSWPSCDRTQNMGALVRACEACYDGAKAYRTPFVSGKDSLNNQLRYTDPATGEAKVIEIPWTLLITGLGMVTSLARCVTMDAKTVGNTLLLIGGTPKGLGASHYQRLFGLVGELGELDASVPGVDLTKGPRVAHAIAQAIADGLVQSAHDVSDGGVLTCVAEMLIATSGSREGGEPPRDPNASVLAKLMSAGRVVPPLGAELTMWDDALEAEELAYSEAPSRYVIEVKAEDVAKVRTILTDFGGVHLLILGKLTKDPRLVWQRGDLDEPVEALAETWLRTLDW